MKRARRIQAVADYPFARWNGVVREALSRGVDVIRLDIGDPDLLPPEEVMETLKRSLDQFDSHGYPGYRGLPVLREAMAYYYQRRFGVSLNPETEVLPLIGSKEGIINLSLSCLDPGDLVLVPDPGYAPYAVGAELAGANVYRFPLDKSRGWMPDLSAIPPQVAKEAALLWLNYPNNPTGATASLDFFKEAVAFAKQNNILICHDAPYCDVVYNGYLAPSLLQIPGAESVAVEFNSLSKTWNMAGWRVAMAVGNADALLGLAQVKTNIDSGIFKPVQEAAAVALKTDLEWISSRNEVFQERMDVMVSGLAQAGIMVERPRASLYLWAEIPKGWEGPGGSENFARKMFEATGIVTAPGSFFGPGGEGYIRFSVTYPTDRIRLAMDRLGRWLPTARPE